MPDPLVHIMFCCNRGEDGQPSGIVNAIDIPQLEMELSTGFLDYGPVFREERRNGRRVVRVGRRIFPISGYKCWVGNWCWDQATCTERVAGQILEHVVTWGFCIEVTSEPLPSWATHALRLHPASPLLPTAHPSPSAGSAVTGLAEYRPRH
jgi:hypothetical protein